MKLTGQKDGQGDKREDGEEGEESGVVIRHNDHTMRTKAWMRWNECGPKLEP